MTSLASSPSDDDELLLLPELDLLDVDDDPEILRAALDFIEACDASDLSGDDSDEHSTPEASSPRPAEKTAPIEAAPAVDAAATAPKPRRVTRNRRKEEIAELRVLVAELEKQVAGRKRKFYVPETLPYAIGETPDHIDVNTVWEHISKRQQQQRQLAELENAKLRNMVMDQLKIARDLTHVAKRRALMEGRAGALPDLFEPLAELPTPSSTNESPLMVRIYPSRPTIPTRVGMAMPLSDGAASFTDSQQSEDLFLEGTSVGAAWKSTAVAEVAAVEQSQATRVAWQSALRQFLRRRRAACCHERVEDILESAITSSKSSTTTDKQHEHTRDLVYTHRYDENDVATATNIGSTAWRANAMWQSPSALLSSLLSPHTAKSVSLRLFRLEKPAVRDDTLDDLDAVTSRLGGLSLRQVTPLQCAQANALAKWQRTSLHASSCF